ncbi:lipoyl(octanoyl) transferase LipB [Azoarcus olearius]|uniref:Octanoyltransferase n=1 Tax=Azoarcus sp. (strain BH72) TaxID=418699 RepID=LIPB_AZOSB|nr:lipoyl(octanoyl) transferase LipB [Azoarcus olearius]A1K1U6.1 RecName: Full=Octanoyltransferase; AltName: Full=Lipoate-protein ligase B; AltName: Full=Lipoyl/octanoyl transferase; AltName: Full=Octanoyl-[acyl-carrier-protein]-protein N-octanoyltransferase [Azoarcus olearius]ANQ83275.1 lipoate-protein ligase B [Azoarcus olearius]CAL92801.1 LipB protein [Azoarcus olearius]
MTAAAVLAGHEGPAAAVSVPLLVKRLGRVDYAPAWEAMQHFTASRGEDTADEIWLLEHPPVYTLGQAGRPEHLLRNDAGIPLVKIDRGGQITYHGPGQLVAYLLLDLRRRHLKVRELVALMEQAVIDCLAEYGLHAERKDGAPGVYIDGAKIAALGLRVRNGCSYHGLALNVDADLAPFGWINPCGYEGLQTIRLKDFGVGDDVAAVGERLLQHLLRLLPPGVVPSR